MSNANPICRIIVHTDSIISKFSITMSYASVEFLHIQFQSSLENVCFCFVVIRLTIAKLIMKNICICMIVITECMLKNRMH